MQEQGVVDDDLMLRTELKTQASVVIAAANAIYLGLPSTVESLFPLLR